MKNESLEEIRDPVARAKLQGYQEAAFAIDEGLIQTRKSIDEKRGVVSAAMVISQRLMLECSPINKAVDDDNLEPKEAKIRNKQIVAMVKIVDEMAQENRKDLITAQGQVIGFESAHKRVSVKFKETAAKYERWQRIQDEEAENSSTPPEIPSDSDETPSENDEPKKRGRKPGPKPKGGKKDRKKKKG